MLLDQRRDSILDLLDSKGFASLQELADAVGVSESTVRRDVEHLDKIGQIRRTRGGAAAISDGSLPFEDRSGQAVQEKQRVGKTAATLIMPGETILLDGGTTTLEVARQLVANPRPLQVVTNSLPVVNLLAAVPQIELIQLGGHLYPKTGVFLGPMTVESLKGVRVRRVFLSAGGITADGLFNNNSLLVEAERGMIAAAEEVIVVADHSKFGHTALSFLAPLSAVDKIVTDEDLADDWKQIVREQGIMLVIAEGHAAVT